MTILAHQTNKTLSPGKPSPQGATLYHDGVNFALYSKYGKEVYLLLFDIDKEESTDIIHLENKTENIWTIFVHGIHMGQLYGYKVKGIYDPKNGYRFNEYKLLIDPYAKAITGKNCNANTSIHGFDTTAKDKDLIFDTQSNTHVMAKSVVIDDAYDWQGDQPPGIPPEQLILYEVHLKGFTAHASAQTGHPGTYAGFIEKIPHLKALGINAVELLPIHEHWSPPGLMNKNLKEYWGYNTIGFFAPESTYGTQAYPGCQVQEFKTLVRALHTAGIEVIIDVVYNHTGEGSELGPTLCFRGIDNPTYYALQGPPDQPYRYYQNNTGTGNMLNIDNSQVIQMVLDSLRYWVQSMHVDGFRFDLATILGRKKGAFNPKANFFKEITKDTVLKKIKLIAEPWDLATYQVGNFPKNWFEWNDKYRDTTRQFLKGNSGKINDLGWRLTGSMDLFAHNHRKPYHSINYITCHDGFTLYDLYTYNHKHNQKNCELNKDGTDQNHSWNCGNEGPIHNPEIIRLRKQMIKNAICCLLFSIGTPMLLGGDEFLRTQQGNNNAYCQDNEISWFDWTLLEKNADIYQFWQKAISFRKRYAVLQRKNFFTGHDQSGNNIPDISWFGKECENHPWNDAGLKMICYHLDGNEADYNMSDYQLFFILNAHSESRRVRLPHLNKMMWFQIIDTSQPVGRDFINPEYASHIDLSQPYNANGRSISVFLLISDNINEK